MKTAEKLTEQINIALDKETAEQVRKLADYYQRKTSEFLRLILAHVLREHWARMQREQHPENQASPTLARFKE